MSDADAVGDLLDDAAAAIDSVPAESDERDADALRDVADDAASFVESTDPADLLAAVGLEDEASSIPGAIARGDPDAVGDLRALLALASLSDRFEADGAIDADVAEVRDLVSDRSVDEGDDAGEPATGDDAGEAAEGDAGGESGGDLEERLRTAVDDALGGFGADVRDAKDRLEALAGGDEDAGGDEGSGEEGGRDGSGEDEDGRDGSDGGGSDRIGGGGGDPGAGRHSTVAPAPSDRADMDRSGRISTMPDRENRSDL